MLTHALSVSYSDILVFDPVDQRAWRWDPATDGLVRFSQTHRFRSRPEAELRLQELFRRLEEKTK